MTSVVQISGGVQISGWVQIGEWCNANATEKRSQGAICGDLGGDLDGGGRDRGLVQTHHLPQHTTPVMTDVKNKPTDLCGNRLLLNDFINTFGETRLSRAGGS